ncbi:hypothetical protein [Chondrinema litorale]|uniref:hypothetical protein n=1 Tax=Chondrinema litorale TaxID=2994555 RepID=UPI002543064C|nr:hypothetical protein [Chondrinema litorale]UZR98447.1 hypothetical protein OQ292_31915 [Chondrinema litorale]
MKNKKVLNIIIFTLLIGIVPVYNIFDYWTSTLEQRYTYSSLSVGIPSNGGPYAEWEIKFKGKSYLGMSLAPEDYSDKVRKKYYVKFPVEYPSQSVMLFHAPVPDSIPEPPPNGWTLKELHKIDPRFKPDPDYFFFEEGLSN